MRKLTEVLKAHLPAALLLLLLPASALAHGLHLDVYVVEGASIEGEAYYNGAKAVGAKVEVFAPDGRKLGETKTDENGMFTFKAEYYCDHRFVVTDAGHRASATVPAEDLPSDLPKYRK
jgi:nickel transport protein